MATAAGEQGGANEWTRIVRNGKNKNKLRGQATVDSSTTLPPAAGPVENFLPNADPKLTLADIQAEHAKLRAKFRASDAHARLRHLVKTNAASHAPVTRAICLGLGAFDPEDGSWIARRRSHVQLAAFVAMVEALEEASGGHKIACFYQEPRFAQPDKDFIVALGGTVVESPASYALVDDTALVFGVHLYRDIWAAALEASLPAVFVGTGWDVWDATGAAGKSLDFGRIREMHESKEFGAFAFPEGEDVGDFSSTCVYWRRREPDALGDGDGTDALEKAIASLDLEPDQATENATEVL